MYSGRHAAEVIRDIIEQELLLCEVVDTSEYSVNVAVAEFIKDITNSVNLNLYADLLGLKHPTVLTNIIREITDCVNKQLFLIGEKDGKSYLILAAKEMITEIVNTIISVMNKECNQIREMTSAMASKHIKRLEEEKATIILREHKSYNYIEVSGSELHKPIYCYKKTQEKIDMLDEEILKLRHALNVFNSTTVIEKLGITVDMALIKMSQLNKKKSKLCSMKDQIEKEAINSFSNRNELQYRCVNYDITEVEEDFNCVSRELSDLQIQLDLVNQTVVFTV